MLFFNAKNFLNILLLLMISFGLFLNINCAEVSDGRLSNHSSSGTVLSAFQKITPCCEAFASQGLDSSKSISLAMPYKTGRGLNSLIISLILIFIGFVWRFFQIFFDRRDFRFYRLYIRNKPQLLFPNFLQLVFALGIPNPKIY